MIVPCRNCEDRKVGCHSECERYQKYVVENARLKKIAKEQRPPNLTKWSWCGYTDTTGKRRRHDGKFS